MCAHEAAECVLPFLPPEPERAIPVLQNILLTTSCLLDCLPERLNGIGAERSSSSGGGGDASEGGSASLPDGAAQAEGSATAQPDGAAVQPDTSDLESHSAPLAKLGDVGLARALDQGSMSLGEGSRGWVCEEASQCVALGAE